MAEADVFERVAAAVQSGRSPLYRWLRARHDRMLAVMEGERPDWKALARTFAELGLGGTVEQPMKPDTVRHVWYRVRRDVAAARKKRTGSVKPVAATGPSPVPPKASSEPVRDMEAVIADLQRQLNERSGRR